jgi:hypothetical protein
MSPPSGWVPEGTNISNTEDQISFSLGSQHQSNHGHHTLVHWNLPSEEEAPGHSCGPVPVPGSGVWLPADPLTLHPASKRLETPRRQAEAWGASTTEEVGHWQTERLLPAREASGEGGLSNSSGEEWMRSLKDLQYARAARGTGTTAQHSCSQERKPRQRSGPSLSTGALRVDCHSGFQEPR